MAKGNKKQSVHRNGYKTADNPELWKLKRKQEAKTKQLKKLAEETHEAEESDLKPRHLTLAYEDHKVSNAELEIISGQILIKTTHRHKHYS